MFSGIISAVGKITAIKPQGGDYQFTVDAGKLSLNDVALGDSIAVSGVCLTAVAIGANYFCVDVSNETMANTTLQSVGVGAAVNLELALMPTTRLGGHIVSGHIDGVATVLSKRQDGRSLGFTLKLADNLAKYIASKGAVCIDGVSLTVNAVDGALFSVNIVPHTWQETTLGQMVAGTEVNLEVDLLARYMARLMLGDVAAKPTGAVDAGLLSDKGLLK